jgi:hypothetical protein
VQCPKPKITDLGTVAQTGQGGKRRDVQRIVIGIAQRLNAPPG